MAALQILFAAAVLYLLHDIRTRVTGAPDRNKVSRSDGAAIIMDTSALIDGRMLEIIKTGFAAGDVVIPKRVLDELQLLADGKDAHKRGRARYGLEVIEDLKVLSFTKVRIDARYADDNTITTDESVLKIAKQRSGRLCTTDYNLGKVASVEDVSVLNVNELAHAMRPRILPGETIQIKIIQKGEAKGQGVGYLEDGTMAVVEQAFKMQGKTVSAVVDRMIQTKAGKMVFANLKK